MTESEIKVRCPECESTNVEKDENEYGIVSYICRECGYGTMEDEDCWEVK
jgi:transposase-like protein